MNGDCTPVGDMAVGKGRTFFLLVQWTPPPPPTTIFLLSLYKNNDQKSLSKIRLFEKEIIHSDLMEMKTLNEEIN